VIGLRPHRKPNFFEELIMATLRSDVIIPEVFTPYVIEQTTFRDAFLASGVVQPMAELNASQDGAVTMSTSHSGKQTLPATLKCCLTAPH
jgi:hypothetical protein